jgi:NAD(P)-dependent dehydrogenase (short-subunit alcohol dehydrogenase family)
MSTSTSTTHPTAEQVTTQFSAQIHNKTILLTGVSPNGLGLTIAKTLAQHSPRLLILTARSLATLQAVAAEITCPLRLLPLDLSSQSNVRAAAAKVQSWDEVKEHGIDILINNAGIMSVPWGKTEDGVETQFAVNHLGPFLFTNLLMPSIIATKGRVVFTSSVAHVYSGVRFEDVNFDVSC